MGYTSVANPSSRRASCTWRETADKTGDISESHWLYPVDERYFYVIYNVTLFNNFCSVSHKITLPSSAAGSYFADTITVYDGSISFNAVSQCVAGNVLPPSCTAAPLTDPGLFLGLPRAYPLVFHIDWVYPLNGSYTFERPVLVDRFFKKSCVGPSTSRDQNYRFNSVPAAFIDNSNHEMTGAYGKRCRGHPPVFKQRCSSHKTMFFYAGSWDILFTKTGMIFDWVNDAYIKSVRFEATVLPGTTIWPVYAYLLRSDDYIQYIVENNCFVVDCRAPVRLAVASCKLDRPGTCNGVAKNLKPSVNGYGYMFIISREILAGTVFTDDKIIKAAWNVDVELNPAAFSAIKTATTLASKMATVNEVTGVTTKTIAGSSQEANPFSGILG